MKYICNGFYTINGTVIADPGDIIKIVDATPNSEESWEDVAGYCDIVNETTGKIFNATWLDVDDSVLKPA